MFWIRRAISFLVAGVAFARVRSQVNRREGNHTTDAKDVITTSPRCSNLSIDASTALSVIPNNDARRTTDSPSSSAALSASNIRRCVGPILVLILGEGRTRQLGYRSHLRITAVYLTRPPRFLVTMTKRQRQTPIPCQAHRLISRAWNRGFTKHFLPNVCTKR